MFDDQNAPPPEAAALEGALSGAPSGPGLSLPPELLEMAASMGIDINDPNALMEFLFMLAQGEGGGIPGGEMMPEEGMPMDAPVPTEETPRA